jgi:hypothetical protein
VLREDLESRTLRFVILSCPMALLEMNPIKLTLFCHSRQKSNRNYHQKSI